VWIRVVARDRSRVVLRCMRCGCRFGVPPVRPALPRIANERRRETVIGAPAPP
jgi:hypothetical protein